MNDNDGGFSTPLAMTVIFSLSMIVLPFFLLVSANGRKLDSYKKASAAKKEAESIIRAVEKEIQALRLYPCDTADGNQLLGMIAPACAYGFSVRDVSTGINTEFLRKDFCESESVREYMSDCGETALTEYGWLNPAFSDGEIISKAADDFGNGNPFPLVNRFPMLNIYYMEESFIKAVLEFFGIRNAGEKAASVKERLSADISKDELAAVLGVGRTHPVLDFLGTKTAFWKVEFETGKCRASAVFAAVPEEENQELVEKYVLVEKDISYTGGSL